MTSSILDGIVEEFIVHARTNGLDRDAIITVNESVLSERPGYAELSEMQKAYVRGAVTAVLLVACPASGLLTTIADAIAAKEIW